MVLLIFWTLISRFALAGFTILDGLGRTAADAGHAVGTAVAPNGFAVLHLNIFQWAGLFALAAVDTGIGYGERLGLDNEAVEHGIDDAGFQLVAKTRFRLGNFQIVADDDGTAFQHGSCGGDDFFGLILARCIEQGDVVLRHDHLNSAMVAKPFFLAECSVF